jgi:3-oxoacid CoA-transferase subunit A
MGATVGIVLGIIVVSTLIFISFKEHESFQKKGLKYICSFLYGFLLMLIVMQIEHCRMMPVLFTLLTLVGAVCLLCLLNRDIAKRETPIFTVDVPTARYYITGDKHRDFSDVQKFCRQMNTRKEDVLIVLGDAGFNYYDDQRDDNLKKKISRLNITLFCLHGNKENRPQNVGTYGVRNFCDGKVYYEPKYPNILFAMDGEVYDFEGKKYLVVGGAHSVDKIRCIEEHKPFWDDEMPNAQTKEKVEQRLNQEGYRIYGMLTHTCPVQYLPTEMFVSTRQNLANKRKPNKARVKKQFKPDIDRSTEEWLGNLERRTQYDIWFCGHYHIDKQIDKICMLYQKIRPLHSDKL